MVELKEDKRASDLSPMTFGVTEKLCLTTEMTGKPTLPVIEVKDAILSRLTTFRLLASKACEMQNEKWTAC